MTDLGPGSARQLAALDCGGRSANGPLISAGISAVGEALETSILFV